MRELNQELKTATQRSLTDVMMRAKQEELMELVSILMTALRPAMEEQEPDLLWTEFVLVIAPISLWTLFVTRTAETLLPR